MGLTYCEDCGHLFNRHYDNDLVDYETDYENSQMFSPRFRRYAEELSDRLITTYHLHQKDIVEIGGGRGDFLRIICDRGNNNGVSFGPSYRSAAGDSVPVNVRFVTDYYTAKYASAPANQSSLAKLFTMCGFQVRDIQESFGGQFLAIEASVPSDGVVSNVYSSYESKATTAALGRAFDAAFSARMASWRDRLEQLKDKGKRVVA
jgi:hypothetical protein